MKNKIGNRKPARIKGMGSGLCVILDPKEPADYLYAELNRLFGDMKKLAVNAKVFFDIGEHEGYEGLIEELGNYLKKTFEVGSVSISSKRRPVPNDQVRVQDLEHSWQHYRSDVLMLAGRVRSGQKVTARKHLLILGDVNPGGEVFAGGDILVMGSLRGTAVAGQPDDNEVIVMALDFRPTQVQIGEFVAAGLPPSKKKLTEFAHVENGMIVVEDYLEADPFGRLPWPQVR